MQHTVQEAIHQNQPHYDKKDTPKRPAHWQSSILEDPYFSKIRRLWGEKMWYYKDYIKIVTCVLYRYYYISLCRCMIFIPRFIIIIKEEKQFLWKSKSSGLERPHLFIWFFCSSLFPVLFWTLDILYAQKFVHLTDDERRIVVALKYQVITL